MTTKTEHVHKLKRKKYSTGTSVFFCTGDDCTFKIGVEFALGKKTICWRCGEPFKLTAYSLKLAKPHCENCHKHKGEKPTVFEIKTEALKSESESDVLADLRMAMERLSAPGDVEL